MESDESETIEFEIEVVESSSLSSITSNLEKEEREINNIQQQQQKSEQHSVEDDEIIEDTTTINDFNSPNNATDLNTLIIRSAPEELSVVVSNQDEFLGTTKNNKTNNNDKIIISTNSNSEACNNCDDASNDTTVNNNVPNELLQDKEEEEAASIESNTSKQSFTDLATCNECIEQKDDNRAAQKTTTTTTTSTIDMKEADQRIESNESQQVFTKEITVEPTTTTTLITSDLTTVENETFKEQQEIPLATNESSSQQKEHEQEQEEVSTINKEETISDNNHADLINKTIETIPPIMENLVDVPDSTHNKQVNNNNNNNNNIAEPIKLIDCKLIIERDNFEVFQSESIKSAECQISKCCEIPPAMVKKRIEKSIQQPPAEDIVQNPIVDYKEHLKSDLKIEITTATMATGEEEFCDERKQGEQIKTTIEVVDGTLLSAIKEEEEEVDDNNRQQQLKSNSTKRRPSVIDIDLAPNEDLEWEFDNEPPFEERHVVVKRDKNPRLEYELSDELGRGRFGTVFKCLEVASGRKLAAKFIRMRRKEDREDVEREVAIMSSLQHRRLLQLYDAFDDTNENEMCLITELVEGGELFERIVDYDFELTEKKAAIFMRQICEGVEYMHSKSIVHLDMKPENILCLSKTCNRIKLIDFGLARKLKPNEQLRVMFGTPDFAAPEVLAYDTVTLATDMWSVGVICYVLLSGLSPFMGNNDMDTMANVTRATFDFDDESFDPISDLAKDFISKLLVKDPIKRLKPEECLKHSWLQRGGYKLEVSARNSRRQSMINIMAQQQQRQSSISGNNNNNNNNNNDGDETFASSLSKEELAALEALAEQAINSTPSVVSLDKRNLKKYVVRRKWHKTVHAIMALGRMGANLKLQLSSPGTTTTTNNSLLRNNNNSNVDTTTTTTTSPGSPR